LFSAARAEPLGVVELVPPDAHESAKTQPADRPTLEKDSPNDTALL